MTQEQLDEYTQRQSRNTRQTSHVAAVKHLVVLGKQGIGVTPAKGVKGLKLNEAQKKTVKIILPFRLPTWNMLLAANPWQRKKVRDWIHAAMCTLEVSESDSLTPMELVLKPRLTASCIESYCRMITPKSSTKSVTAKSKRKRIGRK